MTRLIRGFGFLALGFGMGCSTLQPLQGPTPEPGTRLAVDVNDAGRVALGGAMGPEIAQVEGQLLGHEDGVYLLSVSGVNFLRGGHQSWSGEMVRLRPEYVSNVYERRFSTGRSIAMGAITLGGFTAFFIGRSLVVGGSDDDKDPDPDPGETRRVRP